MADPVDSWSPGFSSGFGPLRGIVTDTAHILQNPINCVVIGDQEMSMGHAEVDYKNPNYKFTTKMAPGGGGLLEGTPSFTTRTNSRGYD